MTRSIKKTLLSAALALFTVGAYAQWATPADEVPAYHAHPPLKGETLAPILTPQQIQAGGFSLPWQAQVYADAARVPRVLYQLPCYCRCDKALGHTSLHSCFAGSHGAVCATCAKEGVYAYRMTRQGKTPEQIREGIEHGEFESIDLNTLG